MPTTHRMRDNSDSAAAATAATETMTYYWAWFGATRGAYPAQVAVGDLVLVLDVRNSQSKAVVLLVSVAKSFCSWCLLLSLLLSITWRSPTTSFPLKGSQHSPLPPPLIVGATVLPPLTEGGLPPSPAAPSLGPELTPLLLYTAGDFPRHHASPRGNEGHGGIF